MEIKMLTSMNFPTLPYDHVTNSFLLEIWFWGPTYPTFSDNVLTHIRNQLLWKFVIYFNPHNTATH